MLSNGINAPRKQALGNISVLFLHELSPQSEGIMVKYTSDTESSWTLIFDFSRLQSKPLNFWDFIIAAHTDNNCYYIPKNAVLCILALTCVQERW